jgi:eukaryotic-like serine/threonine-protein kinase
MPLSIGDKVGHYEVLSLLGQGGMGEVFRARDSMLKRDVALKVLPAAFLRDPDRMARFQREAEVLASLDHPNIGHIYGIADSEDSRSLVLALIEGPTLADRIAAGPLPQDEALAIAKQIIEALEYAHDRGVVHRDLKPANIKITSEGVVKVLDFGLAKVLEDDLPTSSLTNSPTLTLGHTRAGVILGTAAYMSPEQAVGRPVDRRSDIFSFGAVLYEMLTAKRAFAGATTPDVLEAVVKNDPDWSKLPTGTPVYLRRLLQRMLAKDRKQRLQAIGEARIALENPPEPETDAPSRSRFSNLGWIAAAVLAVIAAVALWGWLKPKPSEPRPITRFTFPSQGKGVPLPVLSRDGSRIAQEGGAAGISLRMLDEFDAKLMPGTEGAALKSCFSPDGQWIAFGFGSTDLKKVPVAGGAAVTLADGLRGAGNCDWGEDDDIYFQANRGILRVASSGGKPETLTTVDAKKNESSYISPQLLPGRQEILFTIYSSQGNSRLQVAALDLRTKASKILLESAGVARYAPSGTSPSVGHIVYERNGSLFAVPFDVNRLQVGSPFPVLDGVSSDGLLPFFGFSDSGTLAYATGVDIGQRPSTLVWVDRQGAEQAIPAPARNYGNLKLSPDGGRVAVEIRDRQANTEDIWIYDLTRGSLERRTFEGTNRLPVWTPDGKRLIYLSGRQQLSSVPADGSGAPSTIFTSPSDVGIYAPTSTSPDGKTLMGYRIRDRLNAVLWSLPLPEGAGGEAKSSNYLESKFDQEDPRFSPDGHWVAYSSNESGALQVLVSPFPGAGGKSQVSLDGGYNPHWNGNGRELFFHNGNKMMEADVQTSPTFRAGTPKMLFETTNGGLFDVSPDGRRFLMVKQAAAPTAQQPEMHVVLNWFEELRRRAPLPK